jgi:cystathionine gamma-synthase
MMKLETLAVHAGRGVEQGSGAVTPSITPATTFERAADGSYPHGHVYTRGSNPNRSALEEAYRVLEGASAALAFGSGMAATTAVLMALEAGDHVILSDDLYHGTRHVVREVMGRWGLQADFVDMRTTANVENALRPNTRLIWAETPTNPQLRVVDIAALAQVAGRVGARLVVDNTWATPIFQNPLALGADVVMHSATKYFGGHSDVLGGALMTREGEDTAFVQRLRQVQHLGGGVPAPFDCWLILRSLPTLPLRVRAQTQTAGHLAAFLAQHSRVEAVHYPGLSTHDGHQVATRQMRGFGAMLSFEVVGGQPTAMAVAARVKLFTRATSLGGVESLIEHRASVEGPDSATPAGLLRVSVGLEHVDDLIEDLQQALDVR